MKYSVITFGCRVNQADSLAFQEDLRASGATAAAPELADLVIVNTCSVTATADQGARQTIRRVARDNPGAKILVTGCYATRCPDEVAALPNVLRVIPNDGKENLLAAIPASVRHQPDLTAPAAGSVRLQPELTTANRFGNGDGSCGSAIEPGVAGRTAFTLRVQTGCSEPCAYCIIPATRGRPRSVPPDQVIREIERVAASGFKEIALTGVHLGSYGCDLTPRTCLIDLLRALDGWARDRDNMTRRGGHSEPEVLFRISSLEPMDCGPETVDLVAESPAFAPHFHLPLQHTSDRVLAAMRRPYSAAYYASLVDTIRARIPDACIGSDVIVGFPTETDDDFEQLVSYLERSPLTHLHVFPYSDRPGTEASAMGGKVPGTAIRERARRVREIGRRLTGRFHDSQIGTAHRGLTLEDGTLVVTGNYLKVRIARGRPRNQWVHVTISSGNPLAGIVLTPNPPGLPDPPDPLDNATS
jgi:threonylcarbamoyladenosine tRNA methylthiotransferase MtaB